MKAECAFLRNLVDPRQKDLFSELDGTCPAPPAIRYIPDLISDHNQYFKYLVDTVDWNSQFKSRQTITFGESYNYRSGTRKSRRMPSFLDPFLSAVEQNLGFLPNNCLVNYYPDGDHYISFHSDQDLEMKDNTGVAIISLGAVREMVLRRIKQPQVRFAYALEPGSAFFMSDQLQSEWQHGIPKQRGCGPRISLSFRSLRTKNQAANPD